MTSPIYLYGYFSVLLSIAAAASGCVSDAKEGGAGGSAGAAGSTTAGAGGGAAGPGGAAGGGGASAGSGGGVEFAGAGGAAGSGGGAGAAGQAGGSAGGAGSLGSTGFYFSGTGFEALVGKPFDLIIIEKLPGDFANPVGEVHIPALTNGSIYVGFPRSLTPGASHIVEYRVRTENQNGCEPPGAIDSMWRKELVADTNGLAVLEVTNDSNWEDICGGYLGGIWDETQQDLEVSGSGFTPHENDNLYVSVVEKTSGKSVAWAALHPATGGTFHWKWRRLLAPGKEYSFNYFADVSNDGTCQPAPADHVWTRGIPAVTGPVALTDITHDTSFTDVCSAF